jgi:hypothetical protein
VQLKQRIAEYGSRKIQGFLRFSAFGDFPPSSRLTALIKSHLRYLNTALGDFGGHRKSHVTMF